ncbi:MAG: CDP-glucose 4,6-dehydratase [Dysgonamonadaceae bacterium]|jgi:CDP-glucose 4,6-dehydratase|nr:CDP-glucose 4,6-dehydratase [Dysgonamonadaceae bacterium]
MVDLLNSYKGKKVFLTGHSGFKGSWMCLLLNQLGAEVYGYALNPPTNPSLYEVAKIKELITSYIADVRDYQALSKALLEVQPDMVIHLAAQALVRDSYKNPLDTYSINVMGTVNLLEAIRHTKSVRAVVNVTTDKCYENREWLWGYRENEPMGGYDPYSNSKACSELVTSSFRSSFFNPADYGKTHQVALASARAGNVIGGGDWASDRLIPDFIRTIGHGEKVKIRSPYAIRPWQHVLEPLSGYLMLGAKLLMDGSKYAEAWNFGPNDSDAKTVEWMIGKLCNLWGEDASYEIDTNPQPHEATCLKLDCSKAKTRLGWYPKWDIETAINNIVEWTKAYKQGVEMRSFCEKQILQYFES